LSGDTMLLDGRKEREDAHRQGKDGGLGLLGLQKREKRGEKR